MPIETLASSGGAAFTIGSVTVAASALAIKLVYAWIKRQPVTQAANAAESAALKMATDMIESQRLTINDLRGELSDERTLRKEAESEIRAMRAQYLEERVKDRQRIEELTDKVHDLEREVHRLDETIKKGQPS